MKILIVDDSKAMRMIVRRTLRQAGFGDHDVEEASNGKEAIERVKTAAPDLVLTDWNMPEMTGLELVKVLREMTPPVSVGMVTSQGSPEAVHEAKTAGAMFVLTKPFTPESFRSALETIVK